MNKERFILQAQKLNNDKYDYSEVIYVDTKTPVKIFCNVHNIYFYQTPPNHIHQNQGCKYCGIDKVKNKLKLNNDDFIERSISVFGDIFDYKNLNYINNLTKVKLICKLHNIEFEQTPTKHFAGQMSCPLCKKNKFAKCNALTLEEFVERAKSIHNNKYSYENVNYINAHTKISIYCKNHNLYFDQTPNDHIYQQSGCVKCSIKRSLILNNKQFNNSNNEEYGTLYLIKLFNDEELFYKIGCTFKDINIRKRKIPYNVEIIKTKADTIKNISIYEEQILNNFKQYQYIPKISFSGYTECFTKEILDYL